MEPHEDQWAYLSTLGRISPRELDQVTRRAGRITVGTALDQIKAPISTRIRPAAPPVERPATGGDRLQVRYRLPRFR